MKEIIAPNDPIVSPSDLRLFLAGGISSCPDWQADMLSMLSDVNHLVVYNPRRENFPIHDPNAAREQIIWEYIRLKEAHVISFWFSKGSINPIVLYELGRWGNSSKKPIVVGMDKDYERRQDVEIQTGLSRPDIEICYSLSDLDKQLRPIFSTLYKGLMGIMNCEMRNPS